MFDLVVPLVRISEDGMGSGWIIACALQPAGESFTVSSDKLTAVHCVSRYRIVAPVVRRQLLLVAWMNLKQTARLRDCKGARAAEPFPAAIRNSLSRTQNGILAIRLISLITNALYASSANRKIEFPLTETIEEKSDAVSHILADGYPVENFSQKKAVDAFQALCQICISAAVISVTLNTGR